MSASHDLLGYQDTFENSLIFTISPGTFAITLAETSRRVSASRFPPLMANLNIYLDGAYAAHLLERNRRVGLQIVKNPAVGNLEQGIIANSWVLDAFQNCLIDLDNLLNNILGFIH
jgi:hypothetical protein